MEDGHNQSRGRRTPQAEDIVMLAFDHPQPRMKDRHILERAFASRKDFNPPLKFGGIAARLRNAPLLARVTDDVSQIGFGRREQLIAGGQLRDPDPILPR